MNPTNKLWSRLTQVQTLRFESHSRTGNGWSGVGTGAVETVQPHDDVLVWKERGQWQQNGGREIRFFNTFRWTKQQDQLQLEHLRFGEENPMLLFQLKYVDEHEWRDVEPHLCREDRYSALLRIETTCLKLSWTVFGPRHDESINYVYD